MPTSTIYRLGLLPNGQPLTSPIQPQALAGLLSRGAGVPEVAVLKQHLARRRTAYLNVIHGIDVKDLASAGWALALPRNCDPRILEQLAPLIQHRRDQAGARFRLIHGDAGLAPGESKHAFLKRHFVGAGPVDPAKLPYYVLLVGDPNDEISFDFQNQLDVQFAVGRLHFDDLEDYGRYARQVVAAETRTQNRPESREVALWSPNHDKATQAGHRLLIEPLRELLAQQPACRVRTYFGPNAEKAAFMTVAGGAKAAPLIVSLGHGVAQDAVIGKNDRDRQAAQGALVCGDWLGPGHPFSPAYLLGPQDIGAGCHAGTIWFNLSCFGGGTPVWQSYNRDWLPAQVAETAFVNHLAKKLLARANGALQAVVSHIDLLYLQSFKGVHHQPYPTAFTSAVSALLDGFPIGAAIDPINQRYAELATDFTEKIEALKRSQAVDPEELASIWCALNDARGYLVIGDPAVRLTAMPTADKALW